MSGRKVLFFASLIFSLTGFSLEDNCQAGSGTRLGHTSCEPAIGRPNPAAVFCVENGGTLEQRPTANGVDSVCRFGDGSECGQWPFQRGECGPGQCAVWSLESNSCQTLMVSVGAADDCQGNNGACATDCANDGGNCNTANACEGGCANVSNTACDPVQDCSQGCVCAADCVCSHCASEADCGDGCGSTTEAGCGDNCANGPQEADCGDNCVTAQNASGCGDALPVTACCDDCGAQGGACGGNCGAAQNGIGCGCSSTDQTGTVVGGGCQN